MFWFSYDMLLLYLFYTLEPISTISLSLYLIMSDSFQFQPQMQDILFYNYLTLFFMFDQLSSKLLFTCYSFRHFCSYTYTLLFIYIYTLLLFTDYFLTLYNYALSLYAYLFTLLKFSSFCLNSIFNLYISWFILGIDDSYALILSSYSLMLLVFPPYCTTNSSFSFLSCVMVMLMFCIYSMCLDLMEWISYSILFLSVCRFRMMMSLSLLDALNAINYVLDDYDSFSLLYRVTICSFFVLTMLFSLSTYATKLL